ncbi:hypothetical protein K492DRAFT_202759 [Lichtheimia hyalospora FSU 10163]|nr:hypothetical protein K492DRAFT_202759 [Lichtheimia hyalospora FSU 10163]
MNNHTEETDTPTSEPANGGDEASLAMDHHSEEPSSVDHYSEESLSANRSLEESMNMDTILQLLQGQKQYKNKEMDLLYNDENFLLIHVSDKDNEPMTIIRPGDDIKHRQDIERQGGFYTLSHRWGNAKDYPYWQVGAFITDLDGSPADPVPMVPEKRDTVYALLKSHPGYWWIDVICARVDTPLVIMGSIYRCCKTCLAMVDCPTDTMHLLSREYLKAFNSQVVISCLRVQTAVIDLRYDPDRELVRAIIAPRAKDHYELLNQFQEHTQAIYRLLACQWFDRVWTLQELVLPLRVMMVSDQGGISGVNAQVDIAAVMQIANSLVPCEYEVYLDDDAVNDIDAGKCVHGVAQKAYGFLDGFDIYRESCSNDLYGLYSLSDLFDNFSTCKRSCMDPVDYVYGILGLIDVDIPRMNDADLVWQTFLSKLKERLNSMIDQVTQGKVTFTISGNQVDLTKATNMSDVYKGLLKFHFDEQADLDQAQETYLLTPEIAGSADMVDQVRVAADSLLKSKQAAVESSSA